MKKILLIVLVCVFVVGCSSNDYSIVTCVIDEDYMNSQVEVKYNLNDEVEIVKIVESLDFAVIGESYFEDYYEDAMELVASNGMYNGFSYELEIDDLVMIMTLNIDLTIAQEEDFDDADIFIEPFELSSNDFMLEQEEDGFVCSKK